MPVKSKKSGLDVHGHMDERLNLFKEIDVLSDYQKSYYKTFRPINLAEDVKIFKLNDPQAFLNPRSAMLQIKGRILQIGANGVTSTVPRPKQMIMVSETDEYVPTTEKWADSAGKERTLVKLKQVAKEIQYLSGCAITPCNLSSSGLFSNVSVKINNYQMPMSSKQLYYFQHLIYLMTTVKNAQVMDNYKSAGWAPDDSGADDKSVKPFAKNTGLTDRFIRSSGSELVTFTSPLYADGFSGLDGLLPPFATIELTFELAKPSFYLVSNDGTKGTFQIEDMSISTMFHQLTPESSAQWMAASLHNTPRMSYKESQLNWEYVKANSHSYRYRLDSASLPQNTLPEKVFLAMTSAESFRGDYRVHSGWMTGGIFKSITVDKGNNCLLTQIDCTDGLEALWSYSMQESNINFLTETLPLMAIDKYKSQFCGVIIDLSRSHTTAGSNPISDAILEVVFYFKDPLPADLILISNLFTTRTVVLHSDTGEVELV